MDSITRRRAIGVFASAAGATLVARMTAVLVDTHIALWTLGEPERLAKAD